MNDFFLSMSNLIAHSFKLRPCALRTVQPHEEISENWVVRTASKVTLF